MNLKRHLLETLTLIAAALLCALAANALAARERKLSLIGSYPRALTVPSVASQVAEAAIRTPESAVVTAPPPVAANPAPETSPPTVTAADLPLKTAATPPASAAAPRQVAPAPKSSLDRFQPHPNRAWVEIGGDDVAMLHASKVVFLDARRSAVYAEGHIAGARPFSVWESDIDEKVKRFFEERGDPELQSQPIVIYCSGGDCEDSHMLAEKLWGIQFNNIYVYKDGFPDWVKRGGAVEK